MNYQEKFDAIVAELRADEKQAKNYLLTERWSAKLGSNEPGSEMQQLTMYRWNMMQRRGINDYGRENRYERITGRI